MITEALTLAVAFLSGTANPDEWLISWVAGGQPSASGEYINEENALNCPAVKAAVSVLAESMAMLSINIYRSEKNGQRQPAPDHPLQPILDRWANPETPATTWRETGQNHLGLWGNFYSEIHRGRRNDVVALQQLSPKSERTRPYRSKTDGKIWYEVRGESGQALPSIAAEDMLHVKALSLDGLVGKSIVKIIKEAIGGNKAAERFANEVFKNGPTPQGFLKHPSKLSGPVLDRLRDSMATWSNHGERHRFKILEEGMEPVFSRYNLSELQMVEVRRFLIEEVARAYRITPYLLGDLTHGTMGSITELGRQFVIYTLGPWCARWTAEIDCKLLAPPYHVAFDFTAFLQGDYAAQAAYHRAMFGIGVESIDDIRHAVGMNKLNTPESSERFIPMNMKPLSKALTMPAPQPESGLPPKGAPGAMPVGDGKTPADPGPVADEKRGGNGQLAVTPNLARVAAEAVVAETRVRLAKVAGNAILRTVSTPSRFVERMSVAVAHSADRFREAMRTPTEALVAAGGTLDPDMPVADWIDHTVTLWQQRMRSELLAAAECQPVELAGRVTRVVEGLDCSTMLGGPGSGPHPSGGPKKRDPQNPKVRKAVDSHKVSDKGKQDKAESNEREAAMSLKFEKSSDNKPMDVTQKINGRLVGVEVKSLLDNHNDKLTMHPDSKDRKESWAQSNNGKTYTVAVDDRDTFNGGANKSQHSGNRLYIKEGVGSFRVGAMTACKSWKEVRSFIEERT